MSERLVGKNHPPMHPWCRSTTISIIDEETLARMKRSAYNPATGRIEKVPANMTYDQWYEKYVGENAGKSVEKDIASGIMKMKLQIFAETDIKNQDSGSLKRAIRKYQKQIDLHNEKIAHPEQHIPDWQSLDPRMQEGLKRHWNKEIRNFNQSIQDRIDELKARGDYNE